MSDAQPLHRRLWRRRPILLYGVIFAAVLGMGMSYWVDGRVRAYEKAAPRDAATGILTAMTPRTVTPEQEVGAILLVHGFIGSPSNFSDLPDALGAAGWYVEAMNLPGHGTTPHDFERTSPDDLVQGVLAKVRELKKSHSPVVLLGHSMGGAIAAIVAHEELLDGLILCSPYFDVTHNRILGLPLDVIVPPIATVIRWIPGRPGNGPVNLVENKKHVDSYGWIPTQGLLTAGAVCERANEAMSKSALSTPLLLVHSEADKVTSPTAARAVFDAYTGQDKTAVWLTKSDHVIFWDYEAEESKKAVLDFLARLAKPLPQSAPVAPGES
ncbi:MAG: alpha/beta fold hydrolase [Candidatus Hydrogenedentes bacterium]|nr:alpha/beta fold hydrolase [Candidatus Hydrogenedentota bacterium]